MADSWKGFVSGYAGGTCLVLIGHPLDLIKVPVAACVTGCRFRPGWDLVCLAGEVADDACAATGREADVRRRDLVRAKDGVA